MHVLYTLLTLIPQAMSGSGDLDVLRMIRRLRLSHSEVAYGSHMAIHMALGLLFIGGGRSVGVVSSLSWQKNTH